MAGTMFMRVNEVAEELGVSIPYAYKLIRTMNEELKKTVVSPLQAGSTVSFSTSSFTAPKTTTKGADE